MLWCANSGAYADSSGRASFQCAGGENVGKIIQAYCKPAQSGREAFERETGEEAASCRSSGSKLFKSLKSRLQLERLETFVLNNLFDHKVN